MFRKGEFTSVIAFIHAADLGHGHVAFIGKNDGVVGDEFKQGRGRLARRAARQVTGIVFDAVAEPRRLEHFQIKSGALFQPLCFQQFAIANQLVQPCAQFLLDVDDCLLHRRFGRDVVGIGVNPDMVKRVGFFAR